MLSLQTRNKICDLLLFLGEQELEIEVIRQVLYDQKAFAPYSCFIRIDRAKNGYLAAQDISRFLEDNGKYENERDSFAFISFHDRDNDNALVFSE
jgi:hypothetical protein